jgi:1-deoxy-D-xylulose 5-phosphate reductoisomerase
VALANKETLVTAGQFFMELVKQHNVKLYPVDSEHSAVFQSMEGHRKEVSAESSDRLRRPVLEHRLRNWPV